MDANETDDKPADVTVRPTPKTIRVGKPGRAIGPPLPPLPESDSPGTPQPSIGTPKAPQEPQRESAGDSGIEVARKGPGRPPKTATGPSEFIPGHRARVARVHANQAAWLPFARWSIRAAESIARVIVERRALASAQNQEQAAKLQQAIRTFPTLETIPVVWDGRETNCAELEAQNVAVIAAYAIPFTPDDPLFGVLLRHGAVTIAVEKALEKHLQNQGLIPTPAQPPETGQ